MKPTEIARRHALNDSQLAQLADQMDPAIGEATSVLGAMASELIRRTLRGGVLELGRELNGYVSQLVETEIDEQRPAIDKAAAETATEVARGEVESVRQSVNNHGKALEARIDGVARQTQEQVDAVTRDLTGQLQTTSRQTDEKVEAVAGDLASRLDATASLARTLESDVVTTATRTLETARKECTEQIDALRERSRQATLKIKVRLDNTEKQQRAVKDELLKVINELHQANEVLAQRVTELEKPRGVRALFAWLLGRKNKKD